MPTKATKPRKPTKLSITEQRQALLDRAFMWITDAKEALQELFDDLDEKRSNLEEKFSQTERYRLFDAACSSLEDGIIELDGIDIEIDLP